MGLTRQQLDDIFEDANKRVHVTCDEMHGHHALDGCIGPKTGHSGDAVTICKLVEHIQWLDDALVDVVEKHTLDRGSS